MTTSDIRPYGSPEGVAYYWIRRVDGIGGRLSGHLALVAIDASGNVHDTRQRAEDDPAALSEGETVLEHLSSAVSQADSNLKRRPPAEDDPPRPPPMDPATARFFNDD